MNKIAAQLRSMKDHKLAGGFSVEKKLVTKRALIIAIGGSLEADQTSSIRTNYLLWISRMFISRPVAIGVAGFVLAGSGLMTTVNAAQESLPGDMLYSVKRINERAQIQLASLDRRAILHTEFAERRLREVEKLQENSVTRNSVLVTDAMNSYTQEVASANQSLRALQASGNASTLATANEVDQNLSTLGSTMTGAVTPVTSVEGSVAVTEAKNTTQVAQEDVVTVAVEAHEEETEDVSSKDLQDMFIRQFGSITTRKEFDLHRITVVRTSLKDHADVLDSLGIVTETDLARLERSINIAIADVAPAMDAFSDGGYRSAFDTLKHADSVLRGIEATIAEAEIVITDALMTKE